MSLRTTTAWPKDVDGDVFRRMESSGFDFSSAHEVDFNIDLLSWPPPSQLIEAVQRRFPGARAVPPKEDFPGYIAFHVTAIVTYDLVMSVQREASEIAQPFGGVCESWGVMQQ